MRVCVKVTRIPAAAPQRSRCLGCVKCVPRVYVARGVSQVNVINFTVTRSGLEEQLLSDVVSKEKPDIENRKNRLLISMAADKKQLRVRGCG